MGRADREGRVEWIEKDGRADREGWVEQIDKEG